MTAPNGYTTPFVFMETLVSNTLAYGNGYAEIERDGAARPLALHLLDPQIVTPRQERGEVYYEVHSSPSTRLEASDVLHVTGPLSADGLVGRSVILQARESIATALAAERHAGSFLRNHATVAGVLSTPNRLSVEAHARLRDSWDATHQGASAAGKKAILEEGLKFEAISMTLRDAQYIELRKLIVSEVARLFNLPAHMLGGEAPGGLTYQTSETEARRLLVFSIQPWLRRLEDAFTKALIAPSERRLQTLEFNTDALLAADGKTKFETYAVAIGSGVVTVDEARAMENRGPRPTQPPTQPDAPRVLPRIADDVARRIVTRESAQAVRAAARPEKLRQHISEAYLGAPDERNRCAEMIAPLVGAGHAPRTIIDRHFSESERELRAVLDSTEPELLREAVEKVTQRWLAGERTRRLAAAILESTGG